MGNLVTVVTPCYNSEKFIVTSINSVLSQTYSNWEMIIVDDCSTDKSVENIESIIKNHSKIKLVKLLKNTGVAQAKNAALNIANGRFVAFLDSDDIWHPTKLEKQISFMLNKNIPISFSSYGLIDIYGKNKKHIVHSIEKVNYTDYLKNTIIGFSTSIIDTKFIGKEFRFNNMRSREDTDLWIRLLKEGNCAYGISNVLAYYRIHPNSITSNKAIASLQVWDLYFNRSTEFRRKTLWCFVNFVWSCYLGLWSCISKTFK